MRQTDDNNEVLLFRWFFRGKQVNDPNSGPKLVTVLRDSSIVSLSGIVTGKFFANLHFQCHVRPKQRYSPECIFFDCKSAGARGLLLFIFENFLLHRRRRRRDLIFLAISLFPPPCAPFTMRGSRTPRLQNCEPFQNRESAGGKIA